MRCFIYWLSYLAKPFLTIVPIGLLLGTSCWFPQEKQASGAAHPYWFVCNTKEQDLREDQCTIINAGLKILRVHVAKLQKCLTPDDFELVPENSIVQTKPEVVSVVLTPNFYGSVTADKFPQTMAVGMRYRFCNDDADKESGLPLPFLKEWLAIDACKDAILIIAKGIDGKLGVSEPLKEALKDKKEKGEIEDYKILRTPQAIDQHNRYVKEGKKVFTFIHTAG